jgi:hypothetical protein
MTDKDDEPIRRGDALAACHIEPYCYDSECDSGHKLRARIAALPAAHPAHDEWLDVLQWTDNGEKTLIDWCSGGGDPAGEFARMGLRREMPDGSVLYRTYVATGPWGEPTPMPQPAPDAAPLSPTAVDASAAPDTDIKVAAQIILTAMERAQIDMSVLRMFLNGQPRSALEALAAWEGRGNE